MSMNHNENFYSGEYEDKIFENYLLNPDEIAMVYDEKKNVIVSPLYLSLSNFTKSLKLKQIRSIRSNNNTTLNFYRDENDNVIVIEYKLLPTFFEIKYDNSKEKRKIFVRSLYIEPTAWFSSIHDSRPKKIDLKQLVQNYKRNVIDRVTEDISKLVIIRTSIKNIKPTYVI